MQRSSIRVAIVAIVSAGLLAIVLGFAVMASGLVSVSAVPPHWALTRWALHYTFKRSTARHAADAEPPQDLMSSDRLALGARHYASECAKCHGGPGLGQNPVALAMRPRPQHLPEVVDQFSDRELYWIVANGVRFSAMPAWPTRGRDDEPWSMVAFLRALPRMSASEYLEMTLQPRAPTPAMPYGAQVDARPARAPTESGPTEEYAYQAPSTEFADIAMPGEPLKKCISCHGIDGTGAPTHGAAPNLSIQSSAYLSATLTAYATGARRSGFMQPLAADLSQDQITSLAAYFAGTPKATADGGTADGATLALGERVALHGLPDRALPACTSCHERAPVPGALAVPRLFGQSAVYLKRQLDAFALQDRGATGPFNPMSAEAHGLSEAERAAVASYLAEQPPGGSPSKVAVSGIDLVAAKEIVGRVCAKCHEESGRGSKSGEYPNLTLQTPQYIAHQLHSFRLNQRHASRMNETAKELSDSDIANLAAYFGEFAPAPQAAAPEPAAVARGAATAHDGIAARNVIACETCHGAPSTTMLPLIPRLNGQTEGYLKRRLDYFAGQTGSEAPALNPMHKIASGLTPEERADLAAYFATQAPVAKPLAAVR